MENLENKIVGSLKDIKFPKSFKELYDTIYNFLYEVAIKR